MDRQALLEKKRQRLSELRQRRSEIGAVSLPDVEVKRVDFCVQVDLASASPPPPQTAAPSIFAADAVPRFNKAVQTDAADAGREERPPAVEETAPEPASVDAESDAEPESTADAVRHALEESLREFSVFSDLRLGLRAAGPAQAADTPFHVTQTVPGFLERPPAALATTSRHPELLLVAYAKTAGAGAAGALAASPGLAVVFNRKTASPVPEFFLQCTCAIATICFDSQNPFRVVAGLQNGRIVMWDLANVKPTQIAVLPTLQTSSVAVAEKPENEYLHHVAPIMLLAQLHTESSQNSAFLSVCADGVANVWSPNFLAFPKLASVKLATPSARIRDSLRLSSGLVSSAVHHDVDKLHHNNAPEYRFLNSLVVGSRNSPIYKLVNNKEKHYVSASLTDPASGGVHQGVNCLAELTCSSSLTVIVSAHADWHLRLWSLLEEKLIVKIPTQTLVTALHVRPGCWNQFVTIGERSINGLNLCAEFWDLETCLMSPVFSIPVAQHSTGTAMFTPDGSEFVIGYDDGSVDIWKIEESMLQSLKSQKEKRSIDEGIRAYVTGA